jgi:hypothetical protein
MRRMIMKKRQQINYEHIVEIGLSLIKEETDYLYECSSDASKVQCAFRISGIVDFLKALDEATIIHEDEKVREEMRHCVLGEE